MKRTNKRHELIQTGSEIIIRQGFNAASLNDILTTAGVPKGSFYYYFASKEDFGLAIIDDCAAQYQHKLKSTLEDERFSPLTRLRHYFESGIAEMETSQCTKGCLIGNLAQELSAKNELFRDRLDRVFADWEQYFVNCLKTAYETGELSDNLDPQDGAKFILSSWEGAILKAKVAKSTVPMQNFIKILFEQVLN
jgi:TetR/AcrR family transcriptional repressor of nem operon